MPQLPAYSGCCTAALSCHGMPNLMKCQTRNSVNTRRQGRACRETMVSFSDVSLFVGRKILLCVGEKCCWRSSSYLNYCTFLSRSFSAENFRQPCPRFRVLYSNTCCQVILILTEYSALLPTAPDRLGSTLVLILLQSLQLRINLAKSTIRTEWQFQLFISSPLLEFLPLHISFAALFMSV